MTAPQHHQTPLILLPVPRYTVQGVMVIQSHDIPHERARLYLLDPKVPSALTPSDDDAGKFTPFPLVCPWPSSLCSLCLCRYSLLSTLILISGLTVLFRWSR